MLTVTGLTSDYGRIRALHGIDLQVTQGEILALVGANGAGKTTLLRTLSGVQQASQGEVRFDGVDITRAPSDKRVRLGISQVPEGRQMFGPMTVVDNLLLGAYTRRRQDIRRDLDRMYEMFPRLFERQSQIAGTLSGGEQQMLAIARALMAAPKLLLLDEPSMGLAPLIVQQIFDSIAHMKDLGVTVFLVEQNAHAALSTADRGYVIESGRIVLSGTGAELLDNESVQSAYLGL